MNIRAESVSSLTGERRAVLLSEQETRLAVGQVSTVSLAIEVHQVVGYEREGDDLIVILTNGETIILSDYFLDDADGKPVLQLWDNKIADYVDVGIDPSGGAGLLATQEGLFGSNTQAWALGAAGSVALAGGLALAGGFDNDSKTETTHRLAFRLTANSDSGVQGDSITNNTTPTIAGTAEANASITIFIDGNLAGTVKANDEGAWKFKIPTG
ncbi:MAG: Ig-like domain-containing protein, partial [Hyphomicrobiales bacterium]